MTRDFPGIESGCEDVKSLVVGLDGDMYPCGRWPAFSVSLSPLDDARHVSFQQSAQGAHSMAL
jgi:hypothetical protein